MRFIIKIELQKIVDPVIWRTIAVPVDLSFHDLHLMIQGAMGWKNQHLYSFGESQKAAYFRVVSPYAEEFGMDAIQISAHNVLWSYLNQYVDESELPKTMHYEYDFGDCWEHTLEVLDFDQSRKTAVELLDGESACPPENCGGPPGYERMKKYLLGQLSREEYYDWFTATNAEGFDPTHFDLKKQQSRIKRWRML
jgi:hypothetical protein